MAGLTISDVNNNPMQDISNNSYSGTEYQLCTIDVSNANEQGFKLRIESSFASKIVPNGTHVPKLLRMSIADTSAHARDYENVFGITEPLYFGDFQNYGFYLKTPESGSNHNFNKYIYSNGTDIFTPPFDQAHHAQFIDLYFYKTQTTPPTTNMTMKIYIESQANDRLLCGPFTDTVTITLSDL
eukprot:COSAG01_NODE_398_length_17547_cov_206.793501_11_plen_184_part_00